MTLFSQPRSEVRCLYCMRWLNASWARTRRQIVEAAHRAGWWRSSAWGFWFCSDHRPTESQASRWIAPPDPSVILSAGNVIVFSVSTGPNEFYQRFLESRP